MDNLVQYMTKYAEAQKVFKEKSKELTEAGKPFKARVEEVLKEQRGSLEELSLELNDLQEEVGIRKDAVLKYVQALVRCEDFEEGRTKLPNGAWVQVNAPKLSVEFSSVSKFLEWVEFHNILLEYVVEISLKPEAIKALEVLFGAVPGLMTVKGESTISLSVGKLGA